VPTDGATVTQRAKKHQQIQISLNYDHHRKIIIIVYVRCIQIKKVLKNIGFEEII
jgi:hypothetical protein